MLLYSRAEEVDKNKNYNSYSMMVCHLACARVIGSWQGSDILHFIIKRWLESKDMDLWIHGSAARAAAGAAASAATVCTYYVTRWWLSVGRERQHENGQTEPTEFVR